MQTPLYIRKIADSQKNLLKNPQTRRQLQPKNHLKRGMEPKFHAPHHHYIPIKSKSSNETVSVVSCFGFAYFTNTAFLLWL